MLRIIHFTFTLQLYAAFALERRGKNFIYTNILANEGTCSFFDTLRLTAGRGKLQIRVF
jgi:hypothetical protein